MPSRPSSVAALALLVLGVVTVWVTRQAKVLESDLAANSQKIFLLDKSAPDFHLAASDGHPVALSDYRGKKLVLAFFGTWNNASHPGMAALSQLHQSRKPESGFEVVAVAVDDDQAAAQNFVKQAKIPFPVVLDPGRTVTNAFQIRIVPTVLLIDGSGKIEYGSAGFNQRYGFELGRRLGVPHEFQNGNEGAQWRTR